MAKDSTKARFSDTLVPAAEGEQVDLLVTIDRESPDYFAGIKAKRKGKERDSSKPLNWLLGYDEAK